MVAPAGSRFVSGALENAKVSACAGVNAITGAANPMTATAMRTFLRTVNLVLLFTP